MKAGSEEREVQGWKVVRRMVQTMYKDGVGLLYLGTHFPDSIVVCSEWSG
jgi:hypothetical protein